MTEASDSNDKTAQGLAEILENVFVTALTPIVRRLDRIDQSQTVQQEQLEALVSVLQPLPQRLDGLETRVIERVDRLQALLTECFTKLGDLLSGENSSELSEKLSELLTELTAALHQLSQQSESFKEHGQQLADLTQSLTNLGDALQEVSIGDRFPIPTPSPEPQSSPQDQPATPTATETELKPEE